jgi:hypothetical protein
MWPWSSSSSTAPTDDKSSPNHAGADSIDEINGSFLHDTSNMNDFQPGTDEGNHPKKITALWQDTLESCANILAERGSNVVNFCEEEGSLKFLMGETVRDWN